MQYCTVANLNVKCTVDDRGDLKHKQQKKLYAKTLYLSSHFRVSLKKAQCNVTSLFLPATAAALLASPNILRSDSLGPEDKQAVRSINYQ